MAYVDLSDTTELPIDMFVIIDAVLLNLYPPAPEHLSTALEILRLLGNIISNALPSLVVQLISSVQWSLCSWLSDASQALLEAEFNAVVCLRSDSLSFTLLLI